MASAQYSVNQHPIQTLLTWIRSGEIAVPEIQRPFVWNAAKVRDFVDSLYRGYPVGYLIAWRNPNVRLKDGSTSAGKRILIDGQQRVTALLAALMGKSVINKKYCRARIRIAFQPVEERFEVSNPAIRKDKAWFTDIADVLDPEAKLLRLVDGHWEANPAVDKDHIYASVERRAAVAADTGDASGQPPSTGYRDSHGPLLGLARDLVRDGHSTDRRDRGGRTPGECRTG